VPTGFIQVPVQHRDRTNPCHPPAKTYGHPLPCYVKCGKSSSGATLSTPGGLSVNSGSLNDTGGMVSIGGALAVGTVDSSSSPAPSTFGASGQVAVTAGGVLTVGGAITVSSGIIAVGGAGSTLITSGMLTATGGSTYSPSVSTQYSESVAARNGGFVQLGGVTFGTAAIGNANFLGLSVDASSKIEIGTAGSAVVGAITVDAGKAITINDSANLIGGLVDNGTVTVTGGTLTQYGNLSGSGTLQIGKNATLALNGTAVAADTIAFLGIGAALSIGSNFSFNGATLVTTPYSVGAVLTGFQASDSIILPTPISAATYTVGAAGSPGTLVLSNGATTVEILRIAGDFTGKSFFVSPTVGNGASISLINQPQPLPLPAADPLFDNIYYRAHNPDVAAAGADPYQHYLAYGWHEGRNPDALFDTNYYLAQNPDVKAAGADPLLHFEAYGWKEGRQPSLLFSDAKYLAANPDMAATGGNPLSHYLQYGQAEGRMAFLPGGTAPADPLVDAAYYDRQRGATLIPAGVAGQQQAAASYDATGWQKGLNPDAFFDTNYYLSHNPDVAAAHINPLLHYEQYGWTEGRDPSAQFSTHKYLAAYSDVRAAGADPLLHYVTYGQGEGRAAFVA